MHTLAGVLVIGLVLTISGSGEAVVAVRAGITPAFDQRIALDTQHILMTHNGPSPTCASIPTPPQHDCFWPDPERREFSVAYLTSNGSGCWLG